MNIKAYYAVIVSLILASIAVSVFFIPTFEEISLMLYLDRHYSRSFDRYLEQYNEELGIEKDLGSQHALARKEFKELYEKGNHSQSVVTILALLDLEFARPYEAVDLLKKFALQHPNQYSIWNYLGTFYMNIMEPYNSLLSLQKAFAIKPSKKNLEEQYSLYVFYNDVPNQIKTLNEIVKNYQATEDQYATLGYLLASEAKEKEALDIMKKMLASINVKDLNLYSIEFTISLMGLLNQHEEAYQLAIKYLLQHNNAEVGAHLAYGMLTLKMYDAGLHLLDLLVPKESEKDAPMDIKVEILVDEKKYEEALELEKKRFFSGRSSQNVLENLIQLSLQTGHYDFLENLLKVHGSSIFISEILAVELINKSIELNRPSLAKALENSLDANYLQNHPFVRFILPLAYVPRHKDGESLLKDLVLVQSFDNWEKSILAELLFLKDYKDDSREVLEEITSMSSYEPDRLYLTVQLFEHLNLVPRAMELVSKERKWKKDSFILEKAWILLSAASGNAESVLTGIEKYTLDEMDLKEFLYAAYDYHQDNLALKLSQIIYQRYPTLENEKNLAEAYLLNHNPLIALKIIEKLREAYVPVFDLQLAALTEAAKKYPAYRPKLRQAVLEYLTRHPVAKKEQRDIGYLLLEYGFKTDAAVIFADLAGHLPFKNPDVQSLLSIWGETPQAAALKWIYTRTENSKGNEKGLWLDYMIQLKQYQSVVELVSWKELEFVKIADAYLTALVELKDEELVSSVIAFLLPRVSQVKRLKELGRIARDFEQNRLAETVYYKAYQIQPDDQQVLKQLGLISSTLGKYKAAKRFFKSYYAYVPWGDYEVNYNYGQILNFKRRTKEAQNYFKLALYQLNDENKKEDIYVRMSRAQLLYQLKDYNKAIAIYSEILAEDPGNLSIRADFGNMLLDLGHYSYAQAVLFACYVPFKEGQIPSVIYKSERDLNLAKVRYWKEKRRFRIASQQVDALVCEYSNSAEANQLKANIDLDMGRWRNALYYLGVAHAIDPENEVYARAIKDTWRLYRSWQTIGSEYRVTKSLDTGQTQQIDRYGRLSLSGYIFRYTKLVVRAEIDQLFLANYVNRKGQLSNFEGLRHREEFNLIHQFMNGLTLTMSGFYSNGVVGAGVEAIPVDYYGFTTISAEYHRPSWEFAQAEIQQGSRDRFRIGRHHRIGTRVDVDAAAAIQQYNIQGVSCAVSTYAFQALMTYRLPRYYGLGSFLGDDSDLTFNYSLDSEFFMKIRTFIGPDGIPFQPIPFFNRADNRFFVAYRKRFYRKFEFTGYAGYLYSAVNGGKWPGICGVLLNVGSGDHYQLHLQYIHDVSISIQNAKVDSFLINLDIDY